MKEGEQFPDDKIEQYAVIYRELGKQENARWDERVKWLLQLQSLLLAGVSFAWGKDNRLIYIFVFIGLVSSLSIGILIYYANFAINNLEREWRELKGDYEGPAIFGPLRPGTPNILFRKFPLIQLFSRAAVLPGVFIIGWISVILIVPFVSRKIQEDPIRNEVISLAQSKLLDEVSETILTYETLALDVSRFKTKNRLNEDMHKVAFERYNEHRANLIIKWRVQIARAIPLTTPKVSAKIKKFLDKLIAVQDDSIVELFNRKASLGEWTRQHAQNEAMLNESNKLINEMATDLKITRNNLGYSTGNKEK